MGAPDVTGHPPLHEGTEAISGRRRDDQMKMIRRQAEAERLDGMPAFGSAEQIEEGRGMAICVKDGHSPVATVHHARGVFGSVAARNPRLSE
ncbi:MAG: hypothetical protein OEY12_08160 [Nitrospira sp.]|nr:hypothetical protein [Nitrospira sp.]MDH5497411.1 hypothetical protein [Nitrospira sp.]